MTTRRDGVFEVIEKVIESLEPQSETTVNIAAGATYTVPAGLYVISLGANLVLEVSPDGGTTWRQIAAGLIMSNGTNVRIRNTSGTAASTAYLIRMG